MAASWSITRQMLTLNDKKLVRKYKLNCFMRWQKRHGSHWPEVGFLTVALPILVWTTLRVVAMDVVGFPEQRILTASSSTATGALSSVVDD